MTITPSQQPQESTPLSTDKVDPLVLSFLYASITDMQAVIRALDTKLSVVLIILSIPLTKFDLIYPVATLFLHLHPCFGGWLVCAFLLGWVIGFWAVFAGLVAIDNPNHHIDDFTSVGAFYCGGLFRPTLLDSFINRANRSRLEFRQHRDSLPKNDLQIFNELTFEQMKLAYIRAMKMRRVRTAYFSTALWIATGAICWISVLSSVTK